MIQERVMFGRGNERVVAEQLARKSVLRGFALKVLTAQGADIYQLGDQIDHLHPATRKHWWESKHNATPKEVWQTLVELQLEDHSGSIKCETVPIVDPRSKRETGKVRFLWSRAAEE
jgi:hypothetical protein